MIATTLGRLAPSPDSVSNRDISNLSLFDDMAIDEIATELGLRGRRHQYCEQNGHQRSIHCYQNLQKYYAQLDDICIHTG